jgi:hypothetical protein
MPMSKSCRMELSSSLTHNIGNWHLGGGLHFSDYSFRVHHPVNRDGRHLLAHAIIASDFIVTWQFSKENKATDNCCAMVTYVHRTHPGLADGLFSYQTHQFCCVHIFWENWKCWSLLRPFGIFCGQFLNFMPLWYIFCHLRFFPPFWYIVSSKIWQPWCKWKTLDFWASIYQVSINLLIWWQEF